MIGGGELNLPLTKPLCFRFTYSFPISAVSAQVLSRCLLSFLLLSGIADGGGEEP